jgi:hypothetical protein
MTLLRSVKTTNAAIDEKEFAAFRCFPLEKETQHRTTRGAACSCCALRGKHRKMQQVREKYPYKDVLMEPSERLLLVAALVALAAAAAVILVVLSL